MIGGRKKRRAKKNAKVFPAGKKLGSKFREHFYLFSLCDEISLQEQFFSDHLKDNMK